MMNEVEAEVLKVKAAAARERAAEAAEVARKESERLAAQRAAQVRDEARVLIQDGEVWLTLPMVKKLLGSAWTDTDSQRLAGMGVVHALAGTQAVRAQVVESAFRSGLFGESEQRKNRLRIVQVRDLADLVPPNPAMRDVFCLSWTLPFSDKLEEQFKLAHGGKKPGDAWAHDAKNLGATLPLEIGLGPRGWPLWIRRLPE